MFWILYFHGLAFGVFNGMNGDENCAAIMHRMIEKYGPVAECVLNINV